MEGTLLPIRKFVEPDSLLAEITNRIADAIEDAFGWQARALNATDIKEIVERTCAEWYANLGRERSEFHQLVVPARAAQFVRQGAMDKQVILTADQWLSKQCPCCEASLEIIEGHWLLRDCALCAWCRRWFARPSDELDCGTSTRFTTVEVKPNSDREPEKGS
jgi:hypothetical protein